MINGLDGQRMLIALLIGIAILIILVLKPRCRLSWHLLSPQLSSE